MPPCTRRTAEVTRRRIHRRWQHHPPPHAVRKRRLPLPCRSAKNARPLLAVDRQDRREDRHPPTQPDRSRALSGVDRRRPTTTSPHHPDARSRRQGHRPDQERGHDQGGKGLIASSEASTKTIQRSGSATSEKPKGSTSFSTTFAPTMSGSHGGLKGLGPDLARITPNVRTGVAFAGSPSMTSWTDRSRVGRW